MPKRSVKDWGDLAKARILKILHNRRVCCLRQLEVKVSESGPGGMRPEPIFLTRALAELKQEGKIVVLPKIGEKETPFYAPKDFDLEKECVLYEKTLLLYRKHKFFTEKQEYCSKVLENIITKSIEAAHLYTFLSNPLSPNIPKKAPLDFVVQLNSYKIGGEIKNQREWVYPDKREIWELIEKCIEIDATPIFVARKLPYISRLVFSKIGVLGLATHNQYFSPLLTEDLEKIIHKDFLGYKDIKCFDDVEPRYITFFQKNIPKNIEKYSTLFKNQTPLLKYYIDKGMADTKTGMSKKQALFTDLKQELFYRNKESDDFESEDMF